MATILTILPEGFEEIEAVTPIDLWRRAGFEVKTASLGSSLRVLGRSGITLEADIVLSEIAPSETFDLLFLPGGPGVQILRKSREVREVLNRHVAANRWIAAICAAPLVLKDAGLLVGRKFTAHPSTKPELPDAQPDQSFIFDGKLITSPGAGTALPFALAIIELLLSDEDAQRIALSICAKTAS